MGSQIKIEFLKEVWKCKKILAEHYSDWQYDQPSWWSLDEIVISNKKCGHVVFAKIYNVKRKRIKSNCEICEMFNAVKRYEQGLKKEEARQFYKDLKFKKEQISLKTCKVCGNPYWGLAKSKCCSPECGKKNERNLSSKYRRIKYNQAKTDESSMINLPYIYRRDKGICWICGGKVNMNLDHNDEMYGSIDHVIPISKGGMDSWDNVKLAHRRCNRIKSNKIDIVVVREMISFIS